VVFYESGIDNFEFYPGHSSVRQDIIEGNELCKYTSPYIVFYLLTEKGNLAELCSYCSDSTHSFGAHGLLCYSLIFEQ
jgi:hypothetical protein